MIDDCITTGQDLAFCSTITHGCIGIGILHLVPAIVRPLNRGLLSDDERKIIYHDRKLIQLVARSHDDQVLRDAEQIDGRVNRRLLKLGSTGDGDVGLEGLQIDLVNQSDQVVGSTWTDASGGYEFDFGSLGLPPGTYQVQQVSQPLGFLDGKESVGDLADGDTTNDGTVDNSQDSNIIDDIVITAAGTQADASGYDFAELLPASLQGI